MIRLVVSDLDGTMLEYGAQKVSEGVNDSILYFLDKGVSFAVSSGRTYGELCRYLGEFRDSIYYICCDGALCVYKEKVVYSRHIPNEDLKFFFDIVLSGGCALFHGAKENFCFGVLPADCGYEDCREVRDSFSIREKIYKVTLFGVDRKISVPSGLRMHWDDSTGSCAMFVNRYSDKGAALSDLQTRLMMTKYDTACIGDSGNDIAMMKGAKYSFRVGEKCKELSECCVYNVASISDAFGIIKDNI